MTNSITLEIISPEKVFFHGLVESVSVPTKMGSISILYNHTPLTSILAPGVIRFTDLTRNKLEVTINGGVLKVKNNQLVILTDK